MWAGKLWRNSPGEPNPKRGSRRNLFLRVGHDEENRAAVPNGEAGALEASKALLGGQNKTLQGTVTLESGSERGRPRAGHHGDA